jgi:hypothetical protein
MNLVRLVFGSPTLVLLLLGISTAHGESWHEDPISGCLVWDDEDLIDRDVLVSWSTGCDSDEFASGDGVLTWIEDGELRTRYVGPMVGGKANGWGIAYVRTDDGRYTRYEGEFRDSEIDGHVRIDTPDDKHFIGTYDSVTKTGTGVATNAAGDRYTGEIADGKMDGQGYLERANGERFKGEFVAGELNGHAEWINTEGDYYVGNFVAGEISGTGRLEAVDGRVYEGDFRSGLPDGKGIYTAPDGTTIEGQFVRGWPAGEVDVTAPDGETKRERWADGKRIDE